MGKVYRRMNVTRDHGCTWFRVLIVKMPSGLGALWTFGYTIPKLAAEGAGFLTPQDAQAAAMRAIFGFILVLVAVLA